MKINQIAIVLSMLLLITIYGCENESRPPLLKTRKCLISIGNGSGLSLSHSEVYCDSFQMQGTKKAFVWVDGTKMQVEAQTYIHPYVFQ